MTTTKPTSRYDVQLNSHKFQQMVNDTVSKLYGHLKGQPYSFDDKAAVKVLQQAAESFIGTMWTQVKEISKQDKKQTIDQHDFRKWKRKTGFKLRVQSRRESLCDLFEQNIKKRRRKY